MQVLVHFRLRGILIKLLRLVSTVRHQETTDRPHHARQQLVQCLLQAHLHAPQQYSYQLNTSMGRQATVAPAAATNLLSSAYMQQALQAWEATAALHCSLGVQAIQPRRAQPLLASLVKAAVRQHMHLTPTTALTSVAAEACSNGQARGAQTLLSAWARQPHTSTTDLHCSRGIQGDPPKPSTDPAHIGVHREFRHGQAEQHDAGHALAPQACSRPAQGLAGSVRADAVSRSHRPDSTWFPLPPMPARSRCPIQRGREGNCQPLQDDLEAGLIKAYG